MRILKLFLALLFASFATQSYASGMKIFSPENPIQDGINVIEMSNGFADIFRKLDEVSWGGKNIDVAIENLENLNKNIHIASTDERVILVWRDSIIANYPKPEKNDWDAFGEITTALVLRLRGVYDELRDANDAEIYTAVVDSIMRGIDENGRYVAPRKVGFSNDNRILTSVGIEGFRDERGNFRVTGVYKGSSADAAGITEGDLIAEVNGALVAEVADSVLTNMMSGKNSGTLKMTLLTPGGQRHVVVRRATVVLADSDIVFMDDKEGGVLHIIVNKVSDNSVALVQEALSKYQDLTGIILDLRAAVGDDERVAARLAGLFVGAKPVMRIVETARDELEVVPGDSKVTDAPVVVAVSNMTRGTAEAIASAIYENKRGILIGTPTAGVARIMSRIPLSNGGTLELLNKSVKTGEGYDIDKRGVFPLVCLSNIRSSSQQNVFFLNVINNEFNARDFNREKDINPESIRAGCPVITSGADEDLLVLSVASKILTDRKVYDNLLDIK
ncbi:MAG: PDZ domain-containing protein [Alphaproteobacteria bacterium]|nr:PDZ domain-containing protein [Alphaproteobacteria bacterium]